MNTVVRRHVLASSLPEEFREGIDPAQTVTVTVEVEHVETDEAYMADLRRRLREAREVDLGLRPAAAVSRYPSRLTELGIDPDKIKPVSLADIRSIVTPLGTTVEEAVKRVRADRDQEGE